MIVVIPLGGIGKRFSDVGYDLPKPLIKVQGKEKRNAKRESKEKVKNFLESQQDYYANKINVNEYL